MIFRRKRKPKTIKSTTTLNEFLTDNKSLYDEFDNVILNGKDMIEILKNKIVKTAIFCETCLLLQFTDDSILMYFGKKVTYTGKLNHITFDKILVAFTSNKKRIELYFENSKTLSASCEKGVCRYYYSKQERM